MILLISCDQSPKIEIKLTAQDRQENRGPRWSPYGQKMPLMEKGIGFETNLKLGSNPSNSWAIRMEKTNQSDYFDLLFIDHNQNGQFEESEKVTTEPSESRGKIWSSFRTIINVNVLDPWTGDSIKTVYPISLWYVFNPNDDTDEEVLRFSRNGWLEGTANINGVDASIILAESTMDAKIDTADAWAIAPKIDPKELFDYRNNRSVKTHAWLNDNAYRIVDVHPSGLKVTLEPYDPGMTRVEEAEAMDLYTADKKASRSGKSVSFGHDFQLAMAQAKKENKMVFIDFETTWCGPCKIMDKLVYTADDVIQATDQMISVKIDGDDYPELAKKFEVKGYPTLILISPDETIIDRKIGYQSVKSTTTFLNNALKTK